MTLKPRLGHMCGNVNKIYILKKNSHWFMQKIDYCMLLFLNILKGREFSNLVFYRVFLNIQYFRF